MADGSAGGAGAVAGPSFGGPATPSGDIALLLPLVVELMAAIGSPAAPTAVHDALERLLISIRTQPPLAVMRCAERAP
jgi:hypothetical protein